MSDTTDDMTKTQEACFQIITYAGMARSLFIEAIDLAEDGDLDAVQAKLDEGDGYFVQAHSAHAEMIRQEAAGDHVPADILLIHAEDQLMSAETFKIVAEKFMRLASK